MNELQKFQNMPSPKDATPEEMKAWFDSLSMFSKLAFDGMSKAILGFTFSSMVEHMQWMMNMQNRVDNGYKPNQSEAKRAQKIMQMVAKLEEKFQS